jgi:hypothetical protein
MTRTHEVSPDEHAILNHTADWYPVNWIPVQQPTVWDLFTPAHALTAYDVVSIPLATLLDNIRTLTPIAITLWNTNGLVVEVTPRLADKYHPEQQRLLD